MYICKILSQLKKEKPVQFICMEAKSDRKAFILSYNPFLQDVTSWSIFKREEREINSSLNYPLFLDYIKNV